jgi:hypothetical protein
MKKTILVLCETFFCIAAVSARPPLPDSTSYFPLIPGSYWVHQDSVFNPADAEDIGTSSKTKDSIVNRIICDSGMIVNALHISYTDGKRKAPIQIQYFCDTLGYVFERVVKKNEAPKWDKPQYKVNPQPGDTCYLANQPIVYKKDTINTWFFAEPISEKLRQSLGRDFFAKGIGFIGSPGSGFSTNLIEYRIGNGPVIKKHWLMEAPKGK